MRALLLVLVGLALVAASNPRGVAPADRKPFKGQTFTCRDGSQKLVISQVNDDYCDCLDGSDEPGTSACSNGAFWCKNKGFQSFSIPSWKVNDHICDCCDGSDEFDGYVRCPNTCAEMDRESKKAVFAELDRLKSGLEKKKAYIQAGEEAIKKAAVTFVELKMEVQHKREEVKLKEELKRQAEQVEKDTREARQLKENEEKAAHEATNPPAPAALVEDIPPPPPADEVKTDIEVPVQPNDFQQPPFEADTLHEDIPMPEHSNHGDEHHQHPEEEMMQPEPPSPLIPGFEPSAELRDLQDEETKYTDVMSVSIDALPSPDIRAELQQRLYEARQAKQTLLQKLLQAVKDAYRWLLDSLGLAASDDDDYVPSSPAEILANLFSGCSFSVEARRQRDAYNDANGKLHDLETKMTSMEKLLQLDLGPQKEFYPLWEQTISAQIEQYRYEVKPFSEVNQGHTNMGHWAQWSVPYTKMSYTNGVSCWQGPARSCEVTLVCGDKEEILEVKEPNKCEYSMKVTTPAACMEADVERLQKQLNTVATDDD